MRTQSTYGLLTALHALRCADSPAFLPPAGFDVSTIEAVGLATSLAPPVVVSVGEPADGLAAASAVSSMAVDQAQQQVAAAVCLHNKGIRVFLPPPNAAPQVEASSAVHVVYDTAMEAMPAPQLSILRAALASGASQLILVASPATSDARLTQLLQTMLSPTTGAAVAVKRIAGRPGVLPEGAASQLDATPPSTQAGALLPCLLCLLASQDTAVTRVASFDAPASTGASVVVRARGVAGSPAVALKYTSGAKTVTVAAYARAEQTQVAVVPSVPGAVGSPVEQCSRAKLMENVTRALEFYSPAAVIRDAGAASSSDVTVAMDSDLIASPALMALVRTAVRGGSTRCVSWRTCTLLVRLHAPYT